MYKISYNCAKHEMLKLNITNKKQFAKKNELIKPVKLFNSVKIINSVKTS